MSDAPDGEDVIFPGLGIVTFDDLIAMIDELAQLEDEQTIYDTPTYRRLAEAQFARRPDHTDHGSTT
jgi:hypothetical protein